MSGTTRRPRPPDARGPLAHARHSAVGRGRAERDAGPATCASSSPGEPLAEHETSRAPVRGQDDLKRTRRTAIPRSLTNGRPPGICAPMACQTPRTSGDGPSSAAVGMWRGQCRGSYRPGGRSRPLPLEGDRSACVARRAAAQEHQSRLASSSLFSRIQRRTRTLTGVISRRARSLSHSANSLGKETINRSSARGGFSSLIGGPFCLQSMAIVSASQRAYEQCQPHQPEWLLTWDDYTYTMSTDR